MKNKEMWKKEAKKRCAPKTMPKGANQQKRRGTKVAVVWSVAGLEQRRLRLMMMMRRVRCQSSSADMENLDLFKWSSSIKNLRQFWTVAFCFFPASPFLLPAFGLFHSSLLLLLPLLPFFLSFCGRRCCCCCCFMANFPSRHENSQHKAPAALETQNPMT